jgi:phosphoribosylformylglycinamidine synthase
MTKIYFNSNNHLNYYNITPNYNNLNYYLELESTQTPTLLNNYVAIGPIKYFKTAFSSNVINILKRIGINDITSFDHIKLYDVNSTYSVDSMLECNWDNLKTDYPSDYPSNIKLDNTILNKYGLHFDEFEIKLYHKLYKKLGRDPTFIELYDLCQSNSEHSRHWFFKGQLYLDDILLDDTLFDMVKSTLKPNSNSLIAFSDNSSVIEGFKINQLKNYKLDIKESNLDIVLTAETHNFPTLICPFQGAHTGIGGRIRDNHATGRGAYIIGSLAGYCVGNINLQQDNFNDLKFNYKNPLNILIEASNGASDYGNKMGEPIIGGFTRSYGDNDNNEWIKPIMFSAGIGSINRYNLEKTPPKENMHVVRIGGPAYKIGLGGGFSSSLSQDGTRNEFDLSAVQRGDPQMCNKLNRVIKECSEMEHNPILSIHDQGAGGLANVVKEIVYPKGAIIYLDNVTLGDESMQPLDIWCSEFQESDVILVNNIELLEKICKRENICCDILGNITNSGNIVVYFKDELLIDLPLKEILEPNIQKKYNLSKFIYPIKYNNNFKINLSIKQCLEKVLGTIDVGSKRFLTNKVDRSVSGQIVQQQCVGPFHTPISNYSLVTLGYFDTMGAVSAIGEKPLLGLTDPIAQGSMSIGEMITNIMGVYIGNIEKIKCSANWMWPLTDNYEMGKLYEVANEMCYGMKQLGIGIDGGKDSLSMSIKNNKKVIKSPGQIVITGYASAPNIYKRVTPNFKKTDSTIILIKCSNKNRLGRSIFSRTCLNNNSDLECPRLTDYDTLVNIFNIIQKYILEDKILALHDISDGGLITTLCEMAISSKIGINLLEHNKELYQYLFNEEIGIICELEETYVQNLLNDLEVFNINAKIIGYTKDEPKITILTEEIDLYTISTYWESPSFKLEKYQSNLIESNEISKLIKPIYNLPLNVIKFCNIYYHNSLYNSLYNFNSSVSTYDDGDGRYENYKVLILRDEGSNGDKEMCAIFKYVGFDVYNIHMNELLKNPKMLRQFRGLVYVGGFSHGDALGASHGWYLSIKNNINLCNELDLFMSLKYTFSLGVCNGCQLMVKQKIFGDRLKIVENDSKRFESRFSTVKIIESNNIFFKNMENMVFGIWVAHGEGKFINVDSLYKCEKVLKYTHTNDNKLEYPYNPNGSEEDLAGVCFNGRHLAMMPHPERCFMKWQLPYLGAYDKILESPWLMMFNNIYDWCSTN